MGEGHGVLMVIVLVFHLPLVGRSKNPKDFSGGGNLSAAPAPHPKSLRCATRFRPPHKGEVVSSATRHSGLALALLRLHPGNGTPARPAHLCRLDDRSRAPPGAAQFRRRREIDARRALAPALRRTPPDPPRRHEPRMASQAGQGAAAGVAGRIEPSRSRASGDAPYCEQFCSVFSLHSDNAGSADAETAGPNSRRRSWLRHRRRNLGHGACVNNPRDVCSMWLPLGFA